MRLPDSKRVSELIDAQNEILRQREANTMGNAISQFRQVQTRIESELNKTIRLIESRKLAGESHEAALIRSGRLRSLNGQIAEWLEKETSSTGHRIQLDQSWAAGLAQTNSFQLANTVTTSIVIHWNMLPKEALTDLIGYMSNGKPLQLFLSVLPLATTNVISQKLIDGLSLGKNPRVVAREAAKLTQMPLNRLLTITRTEMLRAYRESSRRAYVNNAFETGGVVKGWIWHCALDSRCCACCVAMHGTIHKVEERLNGHPNCRCAMVPKTATWEELGLNNIDIPETSVQVESGSDWFRNQPDNLKLNTLGPSKYNLYKGNRIVLDDLVSVKTHDVWGSMRVESTIKEALQNSSLRKALK